MRVSISTLAAATLWATATLAHPSQAPYLTTGTVGNTTIAGDLGAPDKDGKYEIYGEGIRANFIAYGASISNLFCESPFLLILALFLGQRIELGIC